LLTIVDPATFPSARMVNSYCYCNASLYRIETGRTTPEQNCRAATLVGLVRLELFPRRRVLTGLRCTAV
jgi:hypothetical protein